MKSFKELEEGLYQRKREDDEYHNGPDPVKHTYKYKVSKDGGEHHERTVTTPLTRAPKHELEHLARKHLEKQGYKIHEEADIAICSECGEAPCVCVDDSHGFVSEGIDKNHPIVKEYDALKKHSIKDLHGMIKQQHKIVDTSEFKTKEHAASHLIRAKHGNKKVADAFGLKEELDEARMSAAVKLQRAFERQQEKSAASRKRGEELLNPPKKDEPKKEMKEGMKPNHLSPGWMIRQDPKLAEIIKARKEKMKSFRQHVGTKIETKDKK